MKLLDRYLLREYLLHLGYCLAGFCMIFIIYDLFARLWTIIEAKRSFFFVLRYYACMIPPALEYLAPASLLLATLYTLWQMTRHNELVAMRASGISLSRIMTPFLGVGFVLAVGVALLNETVTPRASEWTQELAGNKFREVEHDIRTQQAYYNSSARRQWQIGKVDLKKPYLLIDVKIRDERGDGTRIEEISASKAEWLDGHWWFYNAKSQRYDVHDNPVGNPESLRPDPETPVEMPLLREKPNHILSEQRKSEYQSVREIRSYLRAHRNLSDETLAQKTFHLHRRIAMPFACLVVTFFGIPAGTRSGRQSILIGIFLAMACFFGYYCLFQIGVLLGTSTVVWPWFGAWLANIVFLAAGVAMAARMQ